jgi:hypothetical protein
MAQPPTSGECVRRQADPQASHHYSEELAAALPLRGLTSVAPLRELVRSIGGPRPEIRAIRRLGPAEMQGQPLYRRLQPRSRRYVGWFRVTDSLKESLASPATPPQA